MDNVQRHMQVNKVITINFGRMENDKQILSLQLYSLLDTTIYVRQGMAVQGIIVFKYGFLLCSVPGHLKRLSWCLQNIAQTLPILSLK